MKGRRKTRGYITQPLGPCKNMLEQREYSPAVKEQKLNGTVPLGNYDQKKPGTRKSICELHQRKTSRKSETHSMPISEPAENIVVRPKITWVQASYFYRSVMNPHPARPRRQRGELVAQAPKKTAPESWNEAVLIGVHPKPPGEMPLTRLGRQLAVWCRQPYSLQPPRTQNIKFTPQISRIHFPEDSKRKCKSKLDLCVVVFGCWLWRNVGDLLQACGFLWRRGPSL